jgi:ProP effector
VKDHVSIDAEGERARQLVAALAERWPKCFAVKSCRRVPLKIGIAADIAAAGFAGDLALALRWYTGSTEYRQALKAGAARIDLDGNAAGVVSNLEARVAAAVLAKRSLPRPAKRLSLADLRAAAQARKQAAADNEQTAPPKTG